MSNLEDIRLCECSSCTHATRAHCHQIERARSPSLTDGNQLTGTVPPEIGNLQQLTVLQLWCNNLRGTLPSDMRKLVALEQLWLSNNPQLEVNPTDVQGLLPCCDDIRV